MITEHTAIGILGAGMMGCCLALALSQRGYTVDLFDSADRPMTGASLHNEGKLHLGYVYAKDTSDQTFLSMIRGSLAFGGLMQHLTGVDPTYLPISTAFQYLVPRDSQLSLEAVAMHFEQVDQAIKENCAGSKALYLGRRIAPARRNESSLASNHFSKASIQGSFTTDEVSVSPSVMAELLIAAIRREKKIHFRGRHLIHSVTSLSSGQSEVEIFADGKSIKHRFDCVVNCLWGDKIRVDKTAGIISDVPVLVRYKAAIKIHTTDPKFHDLPSVTAILGSYGDLVNFGKGDFYLSWYPLCKLAEIVNGDMQEIERMVQASEVMDISRRTQDPSTDTERHPSMSVQEAFVDRCILAMSDFIPGLKGLDRKKKAWTLGGGIILAKGTTDIDDPDSQLHQRSRTGPIAHGSYITVDTGKYCLAPLHAVAAADMISEII